MVRSLFNAYFGGFSFSDFSCVIVFFGFGFGFGFWFVFVFAFLLLRAKPAAFGSSQARDQH